MQEVKLALFGMDGHQILGYIPGLTRVRLTAVGGISAERIKSVKQAAPDAAIFDRLDELLEKGGADIISFSFAPRSRQTQLLIQALETGKHVLAEKPMATTTSDLEKLRKAADAADTQLRTMTPMPHEPGYNGMRKIVQSGALGEIVQVYAMKSYPYHDRRPQDREVDGGLIEQAGIHAISFIRHVTGLEFSEVFAMDTGTGNPKEGDLQMGASISFRMSNGAVGALLCNYCHPSKCMGFHGNDQLRIHGTKGMIELVDGKHKHALALVNEEKPREFEDVECDKKYLQDLIDCILDGTPTLLSQEDGFRNTEVIIRAQESADQGAPLRILGP